MPSVEVVWKGRCVNRQDQQALCEHLLQLAEISTQKFNDYFGEHVDPIFYDIAKETKQYLIVSQVFLNEAPPTRLKEMDEGIFLGEGIALFGLEFPLYDPRSYTVPFALGRSKRISFVFVQTNEPELNGRIVQVRSVNKQHRLSGISPLVLVNPVIDLRYYLEKWIGRFLGWVKHFYVPDLNYWVWSENVGYHDYLGKVTKDRKTSVRIFSQLMDAFCEEADHFTEQCETYRQEIEAQGKK